MQLMSHKDRRMHRIQLYVPCANTLGLEENVYEHFTLRTHYLWRIPVWQTEFDHERRPIHELINRVFGT